MNKKISLPADLNDIGPAVDEILGYLKGIDQEESLIFDIKLSLEEALINAARHGNRLNKDLPIEVDFTHNHNRVVIAVEDRGEGFDYRNLPDPTREENLLKQRGRGIFLIRHLMDKVEFNRKGNRITMTKYLKKR